MTRSTFSKPPHPRSVDAFVTGATSHVKHAQLDDSVGYVRINVQITTAQQDQLRQLAFSRRASQAELVRQALKVWLASQGPKD